MTILQPPTEPAPAHDDTPGDVAATDARHRQRADHVNRNMALLQQLQKQGTPVNPGMILELKFNVLLDGILDPDTRLTFECQFEATLNEQLERLVEETAKQARINALAVGGLVDAAGITNPRIRQR